MELTSHGTSGVLAVLVWTEGRAHPDSGKGSFGLLARLIWTLGGARSLAGQGSLPPRGRTNWTLGRARLDSRQGTFGLSTRLSCSPTQCGAYVRLSRFGLWVRNSWCRERGELLSSLEKALFGLWGMFWALGWGDSSEWI